MHNGIQFEYVIKPCPWCKVTPKLWAPINHYSDNTWIWYLACRNNECKMKPRTPDKAIRNTTKKSYGNMSIKIDEIVGMWNEGSDTIAYEKTIVFFPNYSDEIHG